VCAVAKAVSADRRLPPPPPDGERLRCHAPGPLHRDVDRSGVVRCEAGGAREDTGSEGARLEVRAGDRLPAEIAVPVPQPLRLDDGHGAAGGWKAAIDLVRLRGENPPRSVYAVRPDASRLSTDSGASLRQGFDRRPRKVTNPFRALDDRPMTA
jgi:hypothetical protein